MLIPMGLILKLIILGLLLNLPEGCKKEESIDSVIRNESGFSALPAGKVDLGI